MHRTNLTLSARHLAVDAHEMSPLLRLTVSLVSPGLAHVHSILAHTVLAGLYITQNKILINIYCGLPHLRAVDSHVLSPFLTGT